MAINEGPITLQYKVEKKSGGRNIIKPKHFHAFLSPFAYTHSNLKQTFSSPMESAQGGQRPKTDTGSL